MAATINGKRRRSGSSRLPSPSSPCSYLSSRSSSCPPLCTRSTPTHALEHQFHRRRRLCITSPPDAVGGVLRGPILSFPERDRILTWRLLSRGSRHRDCAASGARVPTRRSAARAAAVVELLHCCLLFARVLARRFFAWWAKFPPLVFHFPARFSCPTGSQVRPTRPLPVPAAVDACGTPPDPLGLLACSSASRRALARTFWRLVQRDRAAPANPLPHAAALRCAHRRLQASRAVRSRVDGWHHIPLRV
jgi:hypothetical protein